MEIASSSKPWHVIGPQASFRGILAVLSLIAAASAQTGAAKAVGTVTAIQDGSFVVANDTGGETTVSFSNSARILQTTPGQTDLKGASPIQSSDIQVGDRIAVRGEGRPGNVLIASSVIVIKQSEIAERQKREREEWRRGVGGIVKYVDAQARTIIVLNALASSGNPIVVRVSPETVIHRYSSNSVKFDDAKPGTLDQIKPGDQLRARGLKSAVGEEFSAQAIVSGTFRDIAGIISSTDPANNRITVTDLTSRKPLIVNVNGDSQLRRLPPTMAATIAMRLRGGTVEPGGTSPPGGAPQPQAQVSGAEPGHRQAGNWHAGGPSADFQQMLSRLPQVSVSDLNKGDAVMLVATEGSSASGPTAITLLAGVEPILSAAPAGTRASTILSPWNLGEPGALAGEASPQ
ncbi:MAG: hypothetical protein JO159_14055 [Acidobacteria bacterium]|nr:hypothetical protein [Acidobacteriota bacterium]